MKRRDERIARIRSIEREFATAQVAVADLEERLRADPSALAEGSLRFGDFLALQANLEPTYLIRLFAEFETGLREAWRLAFGQQTHPRTSDLMAAFAARCTIQQGWCDQAHAVRVYRNALVDEEDAAAESVTLALARASLCRFFSMLPAHW